MPLPEPAYLNDAQPEGFSLVEAAIVLGVIGLIIGGIWAAASTVNQEQKIQQQAKQIVQIVQNTSSLWKGQDLSAVGSPTGVSIVSQMAKAGVFPSDTLAQGASTPLNPWGGTMDIKALTGTPNSFWLATRDLPTSVCNRIYQNLAVALSKYPQAYAMQAVKYDGGSDTLTHTISGQPLTAGLSASGAYCTSSSDENKIFIYFYP